MTGRNPLIDAARAILLLIASYLLTLLVIGWPASPDVEAVFLMAFAWFYVPVTIWRRWRV